MSLWLSFDLVLAQTVKSQTWGLALLCRHAQRQARTHSSQTLLSAPQRPARREHPVPVLARVLPPPHPSNCECRIPWLGRKAPSAPCRVPPSRQPLPGPQAEFPPTSPRPMVTTSQSLLTSWPGNRPAPAAGWAAPLRGRETKLRQGCAEHTPPPSPTRPLPLLALEPVPAPNGPTAARSRALLRALAPKRRRGSASPLAPGGVATYRTRLAGTHGARRVHGASTPQATKRRRGGCSEHRSCCTCVAEAARDPSSSGRHAPPPARPALL